MPQVLSDLVGYQKESEKGAPDGYAALDAGGFTPDNQVSPSVTRDSELFSSVVGHVGAATAHAGSQISVSPTGLVIVTTTNVQAAIAELDAAIVAGQAASAVTVVPVGDIISTNAQAAFAELDAKTEALAFLRDEAITIDEDFLTGSALSGELGKYGWFVAVSGTGAAVATPSVPIAGSAGFVVLGTGTTTTGRATINLQNGTFADGAPVFTYRCRVQVPDLNNGTDDFRVLVGLHDNNGLSDTPTDGFYFLYTNASLNWRACTADGGVATNVDTTIPVVADQWFDLYATCDGAGTVRFYIDNFTTGQEKATITTNLPDAADLFGPQLSVGKQAGTISRTLFVDLFRARIEGLRT